MDTVDVKVTALTAPNQFVETRGRRLAYRSIGSGTPLVLCTRFRGNMDLWAYRSTRLLRILNLVA